MTHHLDSINFMAYATKLSEKGHNKCFQQIYFNPYIRALSTTKLATINAIPPDRSNGKTSQLENRKKLEMDCA